MRNSLVRVVALTLAVIALLVRAAAAQDKAEDAIRETLQAYATAVERQRPRTIRASTRSTPITPALAAS